MLLDKFNDVGLVFLSLSLCFFAAFMSFFGVLLSGGTAGMYER
jgi:hypothetical protein